MLVTAMLLIAILLTLGCNVKQESSSVPASEVYDPGPPSSADTPPRSEAQRTREMEAKQSELNRRLEAAKAGGMTPAEIEQAYQEYERERIELNQMAEATEALPGDASEAVDYPPPPL